MRSEGMSMVERNRLVAGLAAAIAVAWTIGAGAQDAGDTSNGKPVRLLVTYEPGGTYDLYARLLVAHMGKHMPGNPAMSVQYMPGAGGLVGTLHLYERAAHDGSEIAILPRDIAINQMLRPESARYDARRFNWIGTLSTYPGVMFVASRTGVKTADDLRRIPVVVGSWGPTTETFITPTLLNALGGTRFKIVTGYRGGPDVDLAVERGEVDARMSSWTLLKTQRAHWLANGTIVIPFQSGLRPHPDLAGVPLITELATTAEGRRILEFQNSDAGIGWSVAAPPNVPAAQVALLRRAFDQTLADPEFLADARKRGLEIDPSSGQELAVVVDRTIATPANALAAFKKLLAPP
jgi:tripartite-type tricarboxylate transporter receptor subunit TctC